MRDTEKLMKHCRFVTVIKKTRRNKIITRIYTVLPRKNVGNTSSNMHATSSNIGDPTIERFRTMFESDSQIRYSWKFL